MKINMVHNARHTNARQPNHDMCKPGAAAHDHTHEHRRNSSGHHHIPKDFGRAFAVGIVLNIGFVIIEASYGFASNSMALVADAGHNLSDVLGLVTAWIAFVLVKRRPSARFTYGLRGSSILAALFNAVFLLVATGGIIVEGLQRLFMPAPVAGVTVMIVAGIGILINGLTAWLFASGGRGDINIRAAYLHMVADAAVSGGVVIAAVAILATGFHWIDPAVSLIIAGLIIWATWSLLRDSLGVALSAVPPGIDPDAVRTCLEGRPGVSSLHDLHIWPLSTTEIALTAHLVVADGEIERNFLRGMADMLRERFGIAHATFQIERIGDNDCTLATECEV